MWYAMSRRLDCACLSMGLASHQRDIEGFSRGLLKLPNKFPLKEVSSERSKAIIWTRRTFNDLKACTKKAKKPYGETFLAHDGTEDVILKVNSRCFELHRYYSTSLNLLNVGKFPWN